MTKFVEKRGYFVESQQRRLGRRRFGKVTHDRNVRTDVGAILDFLVAVAGHPGTLTLAGAGEKVGIKNSYLLSRFIQNLISRHFRVVNGNILVFFKSQSVQ